MTTPNKMAAQCSNSSIDGKTLEKARKELNENPDTREQAIADFKAAIEEKESEPEEQKSIFNETHPFYDR